MNKLERILALVILFLGALVIGVQCEKKFGSSYNDGYDAGYDAAVETLRG